MHKIKNVVKVYWAFFNYSPFRWVKVWMSSLLMGFNQGIGIVALVPLLQILQENTYNKDNSIMRILHTLSEYMGITISIESILFFYLSIMVVNSLLTYFSSVWQNYLQQDYTADVRNDIFGKLVDSEWTFLKSKGRNEFLHLLTSEVPKLTIMCYHLISMTCSFYYFGCISFICFCIISPFHFACF